MVGFWPQFLLEMVLSALNFVFGYFALACLLVIGFSVDFILRFLRAIGIPRVIARYLARTLSQIFVGSLSMIDFFGKPAGPPASVKGVTYFS